MHTLSLTVAPTPVSAGTALAAAKRSRSNIVTPLPGEGPFAAIARHRAATGLLCPIVVDYRRQPG